MALTSSASSESSRSTEVFESGQPYPYGPAKNPRWTHRTRWTLDVKSLSEGLDFTLFALNNFCSRVYFFSSQHFFGYTF